MEIKILGTGCAKCKALEKATREAVANASINASITKVEDIMEIMKMTMTTPAMVINGIVVVKGRIPAQDELIQIIKNKIV